MSDESRSLFELVPGKRVAGRYRILRASRQSGLSAAFEVQDEEGGEHLELTVFPPGTFDAPAQVEEYRSAMEPWLKVDSPHVLAVRDLLPLFGATFALVTQLPEGPSLRSVLHESGHLSQGEVLRLGLQLCDGLQAIHEQGLIHGDVKPHTIHVSGEGDGFTATLVDGGITPGLWNAKHLGDRTALIGTPFYAPVEQFGGEAPDVRSDIYNVATVLFEAATGVLPWPGSTFLEIFQAKLSRRPPTMRERAPKVEVASDLERAIAGGLMADRSERYEDALGFAKALQALAAAAS